MTGPCDRCWYWEPINDAETLGECRRRAPSIVAGQMGGLEDWSSSKAVWPMTKRTEGCGEFAPDDPDMPL